MSKNESNILYRFFGHRNLNLRIQGKYLCKKSAFRRYFQERLSFLYVHWSKQISTKCTLLTYNLICTLTFHYGIGYLWDLCKGFTSTWKLLFLVKGSLKNWNKLELRYKIRHFVIPPDAYYFFLPLQRKCSLFLAHLCITVTKKGKYEL